MFWGSKYPVAILFILKKKSLLSHLQIGQAAALEELTKIQSREAALLGELRSAKTAIVEWTSIQKDLCINGPDIRDTVETMQVMIRDFNLDPPSIRAYVETWATMQRVLGVDSAAVCAAMEMLQAMHADFGTDVEGVRASVQAWHSVKDFGSDETEIRSALEVLQALKQEFSLDAPAIAAIVRTWEPLRKEYNTTAPAVCTALETLQDLQRDYALEPPAVIASVATWQALQRGLGVTGAEAGEALERWYKLQEDFGLDADGVQAALERETTDAPASTRGDPDDMEEWIRHREEFFLWKEGSEGRQGGAISPTHTEGGLRASMAAFNPSAMNGAARGLDVGDANNSFSKSVDEDSTAGDADREAQIAKDRKMLKQIKVQLQV